MADPGRVSSDLYVDRFRDRLDRPGSHANIGNFPAEPERTRAFADEALRLLKEMGLKPEHRCVDYGCGSLHVGELIIDYLMPAGYTGLDITDIFFTDALRRFDEGWLEEKQPRLEIIGQKILDELGADPPDFLFCSHVVILVPPWELEGFFRSLTGMAGPDTKILLETELCPWPLQLTETFFWHSKRRIRRTLERSGFRMMEIGSFSPIREGQRDSTFIQLVRKKR
jgi:hypothetical protein